MKKENCRLQQRQSAIEDYDRYKREKESKGEAVLRAISSFESALSCIESCDCDGKYNDCFTSCGGEVLEKKVCIAFCDKIDKIVQPPLPAYYLNRRHV